MSRDCFLFFFLPGKRAETGEWCVHVGPLNTRPTNCHMCIIIRYEATVEKSVAGCYTHWCGCTSSRCRRRRQRMVLI